MLADALAYLAEQDPELHRRHGHADRRVHGRARHRHHGRDRQRRRPRARPDRAPGAAVGEPIWQLPLCADYRALIDSKVADIKNIGKRYGGAITAAWFLAEFVGDTPWVHLDIAGPAFSEHGNDLGPAGGTGVPVRTLVRFLQDRAALGSGEAVPQDAEPRRGPVRCSPSSPTRTTRRSAREGCWRSGRRRARGASAGPDERGPRLERPAASPRGARGDAAGRDRGRRRRHGARRRPGPVDPRRRAGEHAPRSARRSSAGSARSAPRPWCRCDPTAIFFENRYYNHSDHRKAGWIALDGCSPAAATRISSASSSARASRSRSVIDVWLGWSNEPNRTEDMSGSLRHEDRGARARTRASSTEGIRFWDEVRCAKEATSEGEKIGVELRRGVPRPRPELTTPSCRSRAARRARSCSGSGKRSANDRPGALAERGPAGVAEHLARTGRSPTPRARRGSRRGA